MDTLTVRAPMFYSSGDEAAFFAWLRKLKAVVGASNRGRDLQISLRPGRISADELREFRALFHRWGLDTGELAALAERR